MVPATLGVITVNILMLIFVALVAIFISLCIDKTHAPDRYDPCNHICTSPAADSDFSLTGLKPSLAFSNTLWSNIQGKQVPAGAYSEVFSFWLNAEIQNPTSHRTLWKTWSMDGRGSLPMVLCTGEQ